MAGPQDRLSGLLRLVYDPAAPAPDKRAAESELQALSRTPQALEWALQALQAPAADVQALFFACTVVDESVLYRWSGLGVGEQAAVRARLWHGATQPASGGGGGGGSGMPHFVRSKLAASLAHVAVLDWPHAYPDFWPALQACLADPARLEAGVDLLAVTVDHFHSLAQTTSAGQKGKLPSGAIPGIQQRYSELQPVALATLCSLLQSLAAGLPAAVQSGDQRALSLATKALRGLRHALADVNRLPEQQGISSAAIVGLLFEFVGAGVRQLAPAGSSVGDGEGEEAAAQVAAAAMDCVTDLLLKYFGAEASRQMLEVLVPKLQDTCGLVQQRWAGQGNRFQLEDPLLAAFVRLLAQFFTTQLSNVEATPHLASALHNILGQVLALSTTRRSPVDMLLLLEVWHAVLAYLDGFEDQLWEVQDDLQAQRRVKQAVAAYKTPILAVADLLLFTLCPPGASTPSPTPASQPPPFTLDALSAAAGSGSAMDDWLQSVVAAGDGGGREGEGADEATAQRDEADGDGDDADYDQELLVPGTTQGSSPFQADSEADVLIRHAESFLGRAIGSFSGDMLPRVLLRFQAAAGAFAQACQQATAAAAAAAGGQQAGAAAAAMDELLPAFRAMDVCLRLLTRCGPNFPTRGAADSPDALLVRGGGGGSGGADVAAVSGAHAVQSLQALFQLAAGWLQSVQAIAAASAQQAAQGQGQPSTPLAGQLAGGSGGSGIAAMLLAGSRVHKAIGSLTATWLSQLVAALVAGSADPDAAPVAQQLVQGVLSSAAGLLQGLAAPQLAGWQAPLHRSAVWAAESLVALSSIALSSSLKPPPQLLDAIWGSQQVQAQLLPTAHASLGSRAGLLPVRASRALWLSLSDLSLRCWGGQPAGQFDAAARTDAFASLAAPLAQLFQQAAAAVAQHGGAATVGADVAAAVRRAAAIAASIVQSYSGSPKALRNIVSSVLVAPILPAVLSILQASSGSGGGVAGAGGRRSKAAAALLRLLAASLEVLATELGAEAVEQLLGALVQIFATSGGDPTLESDLLMMQLVVVLLSQGGSQRHQALLMPALQYCLAVWERTASRQAAAASNADLPHVRAAALVALLSLLRYRWRALAGSGGNVGGGSKLAAGGPGAHSPVAAAAAAAAGQQQQQGGATDGGTGAAVIARVLQLLHEYFAAAGSLQSLLAAADVKSVLEELYEFQVATKLYSLQAFQSLRAPLAAALLSMLVSRLYRGAQDELADSLFSLAASNWSEFHLGVLPQFVEQRLAAAGVGASERTALLALWGSADLDAHSFERRLLAFLNDVAYYERAAAA